MMQPPVYYPTAKRAIQAQHVFDISSVISIGLLLEKYTMRCSPPSRKFSKKSIAAIDKIKNLFY
jgi:hypothetical protein